MLGLGVSHRARTVLQESPEFGDKQDILSAQQNTFILIILISHS